MVSSTSPKKAKRATSKAASSSAGVGWTLAALVVAVGAILASVILSGSDVKELQASLEKFGRSLSWRDLVGAGESADQAIHERMAAVLQSLLRQERQIQPSRRPRVAVGYGACQDLFVDAAALLDGVEIPDKPEHFNEIQTENQLHKMFAYFFKHGAAAERFVSNDDLFNQLVEKASGVEDHRFAIGGNAPVMALRFAREGADVLLAAKMTPSLREQLPKEVKIAGTTEDNVAADDIHLIMEYKRGERWGQYTSPRANRFIVHSDANNPTVSSLEAFGEALPGFRPDLLLVSGLQMMDNFPFEDGVRMSRLKKIRQQMTSMNPDTTRIHFEMASFVDESLLKELVDVVIPYADSLGMNEQELPNLHAMLSGGNVSLVADSNPRIAIVLDQMREVFKMRQKVSAADPKIRPLTRMHIHTLAYQAIMVRKGSAWSNTRLAAAKASLTANRHVCASPRVDLDKAFIIMDDSFATSANEDGRPDRIPFDVDRPVACWTENDLDVEICIAPNLVCSEAKQTAGGGDNISAAGLFPQVY